MTKRLMIPSLMLIVLFGVAPLWSDLTASTTANALGCALDEGSAHLCLLAGHDIGGMLYSMFVNIWFGMMTIPFAGLALLVWLIVTPANGIVLFVMQRRCRAY